MEEDQNKQTKLVQSQHATPNLFSRLISFGNEDLNYCPGSTS